MNKVLPLYKSKKKKIINILIIMIILVGIYWVIEKNKNSVDIQGLSVQDYLLQEKFQKRDENNNDQPMQSNLRTTKNIIISPDNTVNLKDFGAIGDSLYYNELDNRYYSDENFTNIEHTNSIALQECLNYAEEHNCNVKVPNGTYCIDTYILIPDNIELIGEEGAKFLVYDTFNNDLDDFVFRNKAQNSNGTIIINNIDFKMETYKDFPYKEKGKYFLKFYNLKELKISDCKIEIENKGITNTFTDIDIRGNFEKIDIKNNTIINQNQSTQGGNVWIRNDNLDGKINEINIINNIINKNGNDEAIAIWGKSKIGKINIKNNNLKYTDISNASNDIFITCYAIEDTWKVEEYNFEENNIEMLGISKGVLSITDKGEKISNINILKNIIKFSSAYEDAYGGIIRIANDNIDKIEEQNININENKIDTTSSLGCRQIINLRNCNAKINNNIFNAKVTYGVIFIDYDCEKTKIELNNNEINANLIQTSSILSTKDTNIEFIASNNNIKNIENNYRGILYIAPESSIYEYQKKAKQNIILTNNKFNNLYRIIQIGEKNNIENFIVEKNEFEGITEILYEDGIKKVFNGNISIKDNYFYNKNKETLMNILNTDLSNVKQIETETNYYINKNVEEVTNNIINNYNELKTNYSLNMTADTLSDIENLQQYIETVKNTKNINETEMVEKLELHYGIGNKIIKNYLDRREYALNEVIDILNKIEQTSDFYNDLLITMLNQEQDYVIEQDLSQIEKIVNDNADIDMSFISDKIQICKNYYNEIENINTYNETNTKKGLILTKKIYINEVISWMKNLSDLYINKYIADNPVTINYSNTNLTNQDVIATVTTNATIQITNNQESTDPKQRIFEQNGNFTFDYIIKGQDLNIEAIVNNIDKDAPVIEGVEEGKVYTSKVTPKVTDKNIKQIILTYNGQIVENYENNTEITEEGLYTITAIDGAENRTKKTFQIMENTDKNYKIQEKLIKNIENNTLRSEFEQKLGFKIKYEIIRNGETINQEDILATGDILKTQSGDEYTLIIAGDITKDGDVNIKDVIRLRKYLLDSTNLDEISMLAADANVDEKKLTIKDLVRMKIIALSKQ